MLFSSAGEENKNMVNQQVGAVSVPHFGGGKLKGQADFTKWSSQKT